MSIASGELKLDISLNVSWDAELSSISFKETFTRIEVANSRASHFLVNDEDGEFERYGIAFSFDDIDNYSLNKVKKSVIHDHLLVNLYNNYNVEFKEDALHYFSKYSYQLTKKELVELAEIVYGSGHVSELLAEILTPKFSVIETRGYCQGDFAEVIVRHSGVAPTEKKLESLAVEYNHLIWDTPLYARIDIDGDEVDLMEAVSDIYEYDTDELISAADTLIPDSPIKPHIMGWVAENLPTEPLYVN